MIARKVRPPNDTGDGCLTNEDEGSESQNAWFDLKTGKKFLKDMKHQIQNVYHNFFFSSFLCAGRCLTNNYICNISLDMRLFFSSFIKQANGKIAVLFPVFLLSCVLAWLNRNDIYYENHVYCLLTMTNIYYISRLMFVWQQIRLWHEKRLKATKIMAKV